MRKIDIGACLAGFFAASALLFLFWLISGVRELLVYQLTQDYTAADVVFFGGWLGVGLALLAAAVALAAHLRSGHRSPRWLVAFPLITTVLLLVLLAWSSTSAHGTIEAYRRPFESSLSSDWLMVALMFGLAAIPAAGMSIAGLRRRA